VLNRVQSGEVTVREAADLLQLSERQVRRVLAAYRKEGAAALSHGNRGRIPVNALDRVTRDRVVELARSIYREINHQHMTELLAEREDLQLHCSTLKRILARAGITSPKTRRGRKHRSRRERYPQAGMLVQLDGSPHHWLGEQHPSLCLLATIDDANNDVAAAIFREQEDDQGYMLLLQQLTRTRGRPLAAYHDQRTRSCPPFSRALIGPSGSQPLRGARPTDAWIRA